MFRVAAQLDIFTAMPRPSEAIAIGAPPLKVAGLFAGIGGIELGLQRSGHEAVLLCEKESAAVEVLKAHFPHVPLSLDVTSLEDLPTETSVVTAGFPCQDLSQAGRTAGIEGRNSGLVTHVFRLLEKRQVPWLILENVSFMLRLARGEAMRFVLDELERLGYHWAYRVVDTNAFGLPQRRERVYLVACQPAHGDPRDVLLAQDNGRPGESKDYRTTANGFYWTEGTRGLGWAVNAIPTLKGGSTIGISSPPAIWMPDGQIVKPDIRDGERFQGFPADWTIEALRVARPGMRWKLVGNAVSVPVAEWVGRQLLKPSKYDPSSDLELESNVAWPDAAWSMGGGKRYASNVSRWPVAIETPPLTSFLSYPTTPLSERATAGFLTRARASSLRFPEGFLGAVAKHLSTVQQAVA